MRTPAFFLLCLLMTGCYRDRDVRFPPPLYRHYLQADISGLYSTGNGLSGCFVAIQSLGGNRYIVTSQQWADMGAFERHTTGGSLVNGMLLLDAKIAFSIFGSEEISDILYVIAHDDKPVIFLNEYAPNHFNEERLKFFREEDFPESPPTKEIVILPMHPSESEPEPADGMVPTDEATPSLPMEPSGNEPEPTDGVVPKDERNP